MTRKDLQSIALRSLHESRNWSKADVSLAEWPAGSGQSVVVKDLRRRALWFRLLYGRHTIGREWKAMRALHAVEGVPAAIARPDADCFVSEFFDGKPLTGFAPNTLPMDAVVQLERVLREAHELGVTHGDLHLSNVLIGKDGAIAVIDWASAGVFGQRRGRVKERMFAEFRALDQRAIAKIKWRYAARLLTPEETDMMRHGSSGLYRTIKSFRRGLDWARSLRKKKSPKGASD